MIKWEIKNNVIHSLFVQGKNMINPWGIETADSWAFFSLEKNVGYRFELLDQKFEAGEGFYKTTQEVKMREGHWVLETEDLIIGNTIRRTAVLNCLEDSTFMDFVVRFRFKSSFFPTARINNQVHAHARSNIYNQHVVQNAELFGPDSSINIKIVEFSCADKFIPHMYIRDHQDEWVVHARMIPKNSDKIVIKLCSKYFKTSPLPLWLSNTILAIPKLRKYLWYRSEHSPYKNRIAKVFSPNAFPMIFLKKGESLKWVVEADFS